MNQARSHARRAPVVASLAVTWLVALALSACGSPQVRYDTVAQKGGHNSYERDESLFDQLVFHRVRSFELDFWQTATDYEIHHSYTHASVPSPEAHTGTSCPKLSDCIAILDTFHRATPNHEVVTVWLEPKDYDSSEWDSWPVKKHDRPDSALDRDRLDGMLRGLPLFTPADLLRGDLALPDNRSKCAGSKTVEAAARAGCFPPPTALRGKFIFVLMDANAGEWRALTQYMGPSDPAVRAAFIGAQVPDRPDPSNKNAPGPGGICDGCIAFFDQPTSAGPDMSYAVTRGNVPGDHCSDEKQADWNTLASGVSRHVATNCINYLTTPWAHTHNAFGWPFQCATEECKNAVEPTDIVGVLAASGDIDAAHDDFVFAHEPPRTDRTWGLSAYVAAPGSNVQEYAKGCVMARASTAPDAAYFAVCRPAAKHPVRVQYRASAGGKTTVEELGVDPMKTAAYVAVRARTDGQQTCFTGTASANGRDWEEHPAQCIDGAFPLRGVAASSHGSAPAMFLFGNLRLDGNAASYTAATLAGVDRVGTVTQSRTFDGPVVPQP